MNICHLKAGTGGKGVVLKGHPPPSLMPKRRHQEGSKPENHPFTKTKKTARTAPGHAGKGGFFFTVEGGV